MSWTLAALAILGVCLFAGFWWYERQHPPARPSRSSPRSPRWPRSGGWPSPRCPASSRRPTIVLIAGFALGGRAGLHRRRGRRARLQPVLRPGPVDALADGRLGPGRASWALRSAARAVAGRLGRVALGLWCAAAALAFGAIMDLSTWTTFGRHTLPEYLVVPGISPCRSTSPTPPAASRSPWRSGRRSWGRWTAFGCASRSSGGCFRRLASQRTVPSVRFRPSCDWGSPRRRRRARRAWPSCPRWSSGWSARAWRCGSSRAPERAR